MARKRKVTKAKLEATKRPDMPTDDEGSIVLPFGRLDEPAVSWKGDVASLEKHLLSPKEKRRREKDVMMVMARPEYKSLAVKQLWVGLNVIKRWENEPHRFMFPRKLFIIERVLAQLELTARMTSADAWPELFAVIAEYQRLRVRTAPVRLGAVRSVLAQTEE